ncbi:MAG: hypothetical protein HY725_18760 [Candidatus Rokubacteria bacterium]|nr:hypothetical protein [Candidatus Rokubacteria bacterium]
MATSRPLMVVASAVGVALLVLIVVLRGGGVVPGPPRPEPAGPSLAEQAAALAARGDDEGAWGLYHQALQAAPEDVSLWYALGVTLSRLDRRPETAEAFQYVVRRGRADSEEVRLARGWLVSAGVLAEPVAFTPAAEPVEVTGDKAAVQGRATWGELEPGRPVLKVQLLLEGLEGAAQGRRFATRVPLGQTYRFERLPAGIYRLIGGAAGQRLWDLTLAVDDGKAVVLDLSPDNSSNPTAALYL